MPPEPTLLSFGADVRESRSADCSEMALSGVADLANAGNLRRLDLAKNGFSSASIKGLALPALTWLNLSGNKLTSLAGLENCPSLQVLNLSHNEIVSLSNIRAFTSLKALILNNNGISALPDLTPLAKNLNTLVLSHNKLTSLPNPFPHLPQLKKLSVSNNAITDYPVFQKPAPQIAELRLSHNRIDTLPQPPAISSKKKAAPTMTTTHTLDSLKILDLGSNALAALDAVAAALPYLCGPHARLMQLNLKGNPVAEAQGYQETVVRVCGAALKVLDGVRFDAKFLERREKRREEAEASTGVVAKADEALEVSSVGKKRKSGVEEEVVLVKKAKSINGVAVKKVKKTVEPSRDGKESKVVATKGTFEKLATTVRSSNTLEPSSRKKSISTQRQRDVSNPLTDKAASKWTAKPASHTTKSLAVPKLDTPPAKKPADAFFVGSFQPTPTPTKKASGFLSSNQASIAVNASAAREDQRLEEARSGVVAVIDGQGRSGKGLVKTAASGKRVIKALEVEELEKVVEAGTTPGTGLAPAWD